MMGAWGYGIYENDAGMDAHSKYYNNIEDGLTKEQAFDKVLKDEDYNYGPSLLALADLQIEELGKLLTYTKENIEDAIEHELYILNTWNDPELREEELIKFEEKIKKYL